MNDEVLEVFNIINANAKDGKIVYETKDGMFSHNLSDFANKPIEEILKLLSLDIDSIIENAKTHPERFVNDLAVVNLLCAYKFDEI